VTAESFEWAGVAAPPLQNGELAFDAPWQGRVFGIARTLAEQGTFTWDDFRARLIDAIACWEAAAAPPADYRYYDCFLAALEALLVERGLLGEGELAARLGRYADRAPDHDHHHHAHSHD
jgi:nitrile hydratase accessory protein